MKQLTSSQIRQMYLDFFAEKAHMIIPSASLIPVNDPSLLWINAGVAPLKKYFDGTEEPPCNRLANAQKSIRTNDIENVGVTARHHTLFEMLGNWSIGDYFKQEAISWAWEFLTSDKWLGFAPEKLYVTFYPEDQETPKIWQAQPGFDASHLVPVADNFWDIGEGPCGPDTEIFYDRGEAFSNLAQDDPENYPGGENERWLEIWNLVFSEFNHMPDGSYQPLPHKNVDTGMGLERVTSVIQNTKTNYETDLFYPIIKTIASLTNGLEYETAGSLQVSFKVIADHIRAVAFAISDGALPSNEGRGYIIRRLIRRAVMHGRKLGVKQSFLSQLVPVIVEVMGAFYEELNTQISFVQKVILNEEVRFHETIEEGEIQLSQMLLTAKSEGHHQISGSQTFMLYDTFGFPLELTQEMAYENGFTVDEAGFEVEMAAQRERARSARSTEASMHVQTDVLQAIDTDFTFVGYDLLTTDATLKYILVNEQMVSQLPVQTEGWVVFNRSPFYAEMGGQVADKGGIYDGETIVAEVLDVKKAPKGQFMHKVRTFDIPVNLNQSYTLTVDRIERLKTNQNHTATHLLHRALKLILGTHANQAGSYVGPDRLRFDFSHFGKVTEEELKQIESYVNYMIENAVDVDTQEMGIEAAKAMGAMALFGEKYGDVVRVVNVGNESIELCGGTHVGNTSDIATFKLVSESGIGAGIRRIEALTGQAAIADYQAESSLLEDIQSQLKVAQADQLLHRIEQIQNELKEAQHKIESLNAQLLQSQASNVFDEVYEVGALKVIAIDLGQQTVESMRQMGDIWRREAPSNVLVLTGHNEGKVSVMVMVDQASTGLIKAGDLIKPLAQIVGGGGGGKPQSAQAGGKNIAAIPQLLAAVPNEIQKLLA